MKRITSKEAKELNQNFIKTRSKALDKIVENETGKPKKKDAISSWFSIEELQTFINNVEAEGKEKKITVDGVRIYFGAYSKNDADAHSTTNEARRVSKINPRGFGCNWCYYSTKKNCPCNSKETTKRDIIFFF